MTREHEYAIERDKLRKVFTQSSRFCGVRCHACILEERTIFNHAT